MSRTCLVSLLILVPALAGANIIPAAISLAGPGAYVWTYDLRPVLDREGLGAMRPSAGLVTYGNLAFGSSVTVYDFAGYRPGSCTAPAGWVCTAQDVDPSSTTPIWGDDPGLPNLTWVYTSWPAPGGPADERGPGQFGATSNYGASRSATYATQGIRESGASSGSTAEAVGTTLAPTDKLAPEPGSLALACLALALMVRMRPARQAARPGLLVGRSVTMASRA